MRPRSGYLFPATLAKSDSNPVHKALFNMHYFEDPHSSLNKSFIESSSESETTQTSTLTIYFKILCLVIAILWNSTFVIFPYFVAQHFYEEDNEYITEPLMLNCWRLQCVTIFFGIFALIRRIFCLDNYFKQQRISQLLSHSVFSGLSLAVWSTGIMYSADMTSPFNAYLLGYSFPAILSGIIILLGMTVLRSQSQSQEQSQVKRNGHRKENANPRDGSLKEKSNKSFGTSFFKIGTQIRSHHLSYNEKLGTTTFFLGILIMIFSKLLNSYTGTMRKSSL